MYETYVMEPPKTQKYPCRRHIIRFTFLRIFINFAGFKEKIICKISAT